MQLSKHVLVAGLQEYGVHGLLVAPEQAPLPSQDLSPDSPSPSQVPLSQVVPAG